MSRPIFLRWRYIYLRIEGYATIRLRFLLKVFCVVGKFNVYKHKFKHNGITDTDTGILNRANTKKYSFFLILQNRLHHIIFKFSNTKGEGNCSVLYRNHDARSSASGSCANTLWNTTLPDLHRTSKRPSHLLSSLNITERLSPLTTPQ